MVSITSNILYINEGDSYNQETFNEYDIVLLIKENNKIDVLKDSYGKLQVPSHPYTKKSSVDFSKIKVLDFVRTKSFIGCVTAVMNRGYNELLVVNGYSYKTDKVYNGVIFKDKHHAIIEHITLDDIGKHTGPSYERVRSALILGAYAKGFNKTTILAFDSVQHDLNPSIIDGQINHPSKAPVFINTTSREIVLDSRSGRGYIYRNGVYASIKE